MRPDGGCSSPWAVLLRDEPSLVYECCHHQWAAAREVNPCGHEEWWGRLATLVSWLLRLLEERVTTEQSA